MGKLKENPIQWLPDVGKKDSDCTILELWSRYHNDIADFRGFDKKEQTISNYTGQLKVIEASLKQQPALVLNGFDVWEVAVSVRFQGSGKPYQVSTLSKRLTIMTDIFEFVEAFGIGINPIAKAPWKLMDREVSFELDAEDIQGELVKKAGNRILPRYLFLKQEQRLMTKIFENVEKDGKWLGLALLLWCGVRPAECRGLRFSDLHHFADYPDRRWLTVVTSADENGNSKKRVKTQNSVRLIPVHLELEDVLKRRQLFMEATGVEDVKKMPLVCQGNEFETPCSAWSFAKFVKDEVSQVFSEAFLENAAVANYIDMDLSAKKAKLTSKYSTEAANADMELSARMFRRNFATKNGATSQSESDVHFSMGHDDDSQKFPYSENLLYKRCLKMDERVILQELHWKEEESGEEVEEAFEEGSC
ncbi:hypothetical protein RFF05_12645 [Bengtsoniella intestinalis]|uniref:hypothetical protein n=1 Tax=Bengtsoniella intestinalis TaxID=3073143 RepID=UPI00391F2E81